jgi:hypothetical protein
MHLPFLTPRLERAIQRNRAALRRLWHGAWPKSAAVGAYSPSVFGRLTDTPPPRPQNGRVKIWANLPFPLPPAPQSVLRGGRWVGVCRVDRYRKTE